jgi:hypothetical protein
MERTKDVMMLTAKHIEDLLTIKFRQITGALESLTKFGSETGEETQTKEKLLFDYWAISRALEVKR